MLIVENWPLPRRRRFRKPAPPRPHPPHPHRTTRPADILPRAQFFLSRLDGNLGLYLGLTGQTIDGVAAYYAGYATHFVPGDRLQALEARLAELEAGASTSQINAAINEFVADKKELEAAGKYELVGVVRKAIDVSPAGCCVALPRRGDLS